MKVKKTYGKRKFEPTAVLLPRKSLNKDDTLENDYWKDEDEFDKLFDEKCEKPKKSVKKINAEYNRDSSLDDSKILKLKTKKRKGRKATKDLDSSYDELYEEYLKEKKLKLQDKKRQAAVRKAQLKKIEKKISTPLANKLRKKKIDLEFEVSPINNDDVSRKSVNAFDLLKEKKIKENEERLKKLETSAMKQGRELLARAAKMKEEKLRKEQELQVLSDLSLEVPTTPAQRKSRLLGKRKLNLTGEVSKENEEPSYRTLGTLEASVMEVPEICVISPEKEESLKISKRFKSRSEIDEESEEAEEFDVSEKSEEVEEETEKSEVNGELQVEMSQTAENLMEIENSEVAEDSRAQVSQAAEISIEIEKSEEADELEETKMSKVAENFNKTEEFEDLEETKKTEVPENPLKSYENLEFSLTQEVPPMECFITTRKSKLSQICDKSEDAPASETLRTLRNSPLEVFKPPLKKSPVFLKPIPTVNFVSQRKKIKSVGFSSDNSNSSINESISLQPGKWRKSLIAYRKSRNHDEKSLRATTVILEEDSLEEIEKSVLLEQSDEGNLQAALSILDVSIKCASTFHEQRKTSQRQTSVFDRSSIFYGLQTPLIDDTVVVQPVLSARQIVLRRCGQQDPLSFDEIYSESQLPNCCKIGEGVYGEVFMYKCPTTHQPIVLKIIPIEGNLLVNGESQKRFDEILQEIVISLELSALRNGKDNATDGFVNVKRVTCVQGAYPEHLIDEWELYRDNRTEGSDNDHPEIFPDDQLYVVFELCNGGKDLEAFVFNNAAEAQSVFLQTALTLAVAEQKFQFEHRDLHWGNILIAPTADKFTEFRINGKIVKLLTHGVKVTIIDYSLSRMVYDGAVLYDDLERDEELFQSTGDYQFDIYRFMKQRVENNWERYEPFTNVLWLHYIVDKLINGARYRYSKTKKHRAAINEMMQERDELLNFMSANDYANHLEI